MEKIQWKVDGMDCSNCALTIRKYLEKQGVQDVKVNFATGDVGFTKAEDMNTDRLATAIGDLGYTVVGAQTEKKKAAPFLGNHLQRFWFCLPFTLLFLLHMIPGVHIHWLMNPWIQLVLATPVYIVGMSFFGKSAW